jgi:hypothetical protein
VRQPTLPCLNKIAGTCGQYPEKWKSPMSQAPKNRTSSIEITCTAAEKAQLKLKAKLHDRTLSRYLVEAGLAATHPKAITLAQLHWQLGRLAEILQIQTCDREYVSQAIELICETRRQLATGEIFLDQGRDAD